MSDFVAEIRPLRSVPSQRYSPIYSPGEFVAEVGPKIHNFLPPRNPTYSPPRNHNSSNDLNEDLQTILSGRPCSTDSITRVLKGAILELIETVLTGRSVSRVEGRLHISLSIYEEPIVINLNKTFPGFHTTNNVTCPSLETTLNVKRKRADAPRSLCLNEGSFEAISPFQEFDRDPCHALSDGDGKFLSPLEFCRDGEGLIPSPPNVPCCNSGSPPPSREDVGTAALSQTKNPVIEARMEVPKPRESDDESGYTSNEKEESDTACERSVHSNRSRPRKAFSTFNDYYCNGFDGKNTLYSSQDRNSTVTSSFMNTPTSPGSSRYGSDDIDDNDDEVEMEHRLIIDESPKNQMFCNIKGSENSSEVTMDTSTGVLNFNIGDVHAVFQPKRGASISQIDEADDTDYPVSSDITDTDVPVDTSGDSRLSSDITSAVSHPQSFVFRHPEGFMCKLCSHVMADTEAVSSHVQSVHSLYICTFCCSTFTAKNNLKRHIRIHTGHRPYKCSQCPQSFARRDDLKGHMLRHDYTKPFRCFICKKGYTDRACVKNHMAKEHGSRLMYVCPQCGESYDQDEAFAAHKKSHMELQQFSCDTCSFIGTNHLMTQKHHLLHSHKLFSCKPCNAYFADPFDYTNHVRQHKKLNSFSQYVCCFCDLVLSTYDQYIRHEYSHAQGKTHGCKTCKKQFKSKSLLQEHAIIHQDHDLKDRTEEVEGSKNMEIRDLQVVEDQGQEIQDMDSTFTDDYNNRPYDLSLPGHVHETCHSTQEENDFDDFQGELLDLSLKKTSSPNNTILEPSSINSCPRLAELTETNFPRNGEVLSASFNLSQELGASQSLLRSTQTSGNHFRSERNANTLFQSHHPSERKTNTVFQVNPRSDRNANIFQVPNSVNGNFHTSTEKFLFAQNSQLTKSESRQLQQSISQENAMIPPLRFSPYYRKKMADFAAKFVAARGRKLLEQRRPKNNLVPMSENTDQENETVEVPNREKNPAFTPSKYQLTSNKINRTEYENSPLLTQPVYSNESSVPSCQTRKNFDEILREETNPETALKYHVSVVVKSEPVCEHGIETEYTRKLQKTTSENHNNFVNSLNESLLSSYICEDCKEEFTSFPELENHSIEAHKRYLCEHCRKSFTARPNRDRHVRYHTGERPYKCDLCDLAFFRGDDLKYHRTTRHPTAQPFVCRRCSASFTWGRDLERHIRHSKCRP